MKSFYEAGPERGDLAPLAPSTTAFPIPTRARVAVYEAAGSAPRVEEVSSHGVGEYIEALASRVYELARERGGDIPYTVIREVSENLIHADFTEPVVSILDGGATVRFADQGPGISDKAHAVLPGFTTAKSCMKRHIRGVGSGLPIVKDYLSVSGGDLMIEDNLGCGAVVTVRSGSVHRPEPATPGSPGVTSPAPAPKRGTGDVSPPLVFGDDRPTGALKDPVAKPLLSTRQKQVLALVMESGTAGPSLVAADLGVALSTAYRDLATLEDQGLISADSGKRRLTDEGLTYLKEMTSGY
jgi:hypothetical protein